MKPLVVKLLHLLFSGYLIPRVDEAADWDGVPRFPNGLLGGCVLWNCTEEDEVQNKATTPSWKERLPLGPSLSVTIYYSKLWSLRGKWIRILDLMHSTDLSTRITATTSFTVVTTTIHCNYCKKDRDNTCSHKAYTLPLVCRIRQDSQKQRHKGRVCLAEATADVLMDYDHTTVCRTLHSYSWLLVGEKCVRRGVDNLAVDYRVAHCSQAAWSIFRDESL